ncbi:hypothetical protein MTR67_031975 [Solanum verrucosum]|uniref:Uncharacterized protein n=1 Tax=Solanum verrucosum TaxID=315347 RepID=A0AAF0U3G1_SOLVR|nr:hypothetical protein MTR67_031975 [Solanum verrucosum]
MGHLVSFCKFAEKLVDRNERIYVTIFIIRPTWDSRIDAYMERSSSAPEGSRIRYIALAKIEPPSSEELAKSVENYISLLIANYRPIVKDAIIMKCAGIFEPSQLIEMAIGLEQSGVRFLWSIRLPVDAETTKLEEILPEGFLERTKNRGIAEEMEKAITCIMDSENPTRKKVKDMGEIFRMALMEGGSSYISLGRFIETILDYCN